MIPRSFWDEDPRFQDTFSAAQREMIRTEFGESSLLLFEHELRVCSSPTDVFSPCHTGIPSQRPRPCRGVRCSFDSSDEARGSRWRVCLVWRPVSVTAGSLPHTYNV